MLGRVISKPLQPEVATHRLCRRFSGIETEFTIAPTLVDEQHRTSFSFLFRGADGCRSDDETCPPKEKTPFFVKFIAFHTPESQILRLC